MIKPKTLADYPNQSYTHQKINVNGRLFVQRYIKCHKENCWCATGSNPNKADAPGHGPYWYEVILFNKKWIYRYNGKTLKISEVRKPS